MNTTIVGRGGSAAATTPGIANRAQAQRNRTSTSHLEPEGAGADRSTPAGDRRTGRKRPHAGRPLSVLPPSVATPRPTNGSSVRSVTGVRSLPRRTYHAVMTPPPDQLPQVKLKI